MRPERMLYDIKSVLFGVAVGDALGVPVEFKSRQEIRKNPVIDMIGYGTYPVPVGTWSDDSSLTFCLAEALTHDFDLNAIGENFVQWLHHGYWTARGTVFDVGITTRVAINRIARGIEPEYAGGAGEGDNGNGSLMRIAPLFFYLSDKLIDQRYTVTHKVSAITHRHVRAVIACFYYLEFARQLWEGKDKFEAYENLQTAIPSHLSMLSVQPEEIEVFNRLLKGNIAELADDYIYSDGYVLHTLEASIWCLLTTTDYKEAVLKAVNLGDDTDTTAAVTGGLAGLLYGFNNIPQNWVTQIARRDDIESLAEQLEQKHVCSPKLSPKKACICYLPYRSYA
ncbi:MAG: ADP-ribosylglycohydrolase family protein [Prevotellaceae bacterium]|nr:ADP-ribosylglycohydrolase family protein [Prevotellaceae bacterium]